MIPEKSLISQISSSSAKQLLLTITLLKNRNTFLHNIKPFKIDLKHSNRIKVTFQQIQYFLIEKNTEKRVSRGYSQVRMVFKELKGLIVSLVNEIYYQHGNNDKKELEEKKILEVRTAVEIMSIAQFMGQ